MNEIIQREFQRHFHKYKAQKCQVSDSQGSIIGTWIPNNGLPNSDSQALDTKNKFEALKQQFSGSGSTTVNDSQDMTVNKPCELCKKPSNFNHKHWQEGEEIESAICYKCAKFKGIKQPKA